MDLKPMSMWTRIVKVTRADGTTEWDVILEADGADCRLCGCSGEAEAEAVRTCIAAVVLSFNEVMGTSLIIERGMELLGELRRCQN